MTYKRKWWQRPRLHKTTLVGDGTRIIGTRSQLVPQKWMEFEHKHGYGFAFLGFWFLIGRDIWGSRPGISLELKPKLWILGIHTPSITQTMYHNGQWGGVPHVFRPIRETDIYIRLGQNVGVWEHDLTTHKYTRQRDKFAWRIDLGKCDHLYDAIKWVLHRRMGHIHSGIYPIIGKLAYKRTINDELPHDFDALMWGEQCLHQNLD